MTSEQTPGARFVSPDVRKTPQDGLAGDQPCAGRVAVRHQRLEPHEDDEAAVSGDEFDVPLERRKVHDAGADEGVEHRAAAGDHLVVRRVDGEGVGPQPLERGDIAFEGGDALLVVERANQFLIRNIILRDADSPNPARFGGVYRH